MGLAAVLTHWRRGAGVGVAVAPLRALFALETSGVGGVTGAPLTLDA